jgi:hypothetical protein
MEAELASEQWMIEDLVELMEPKSILDGLKQLRAISYFAFCSPIVC